MASARSRTPTGARNPNADEARCHPLQPRETGAGTTAELPNGVVRRVCAGIACSSPVALAALNQIRGDFGRLRARDLPVGAIHECISAIAQQPLVGDLGSVQLLSHHGLNRIAPEGNDRTKSRVRRLRHSSPHQVAACRGGRSESSRAVSGPTLHLLTQSCQASQPRGQAGFHQLGGAAETRSPARLHDVVSLASSPAG